VNYFDELEEAGYDVDRTPVDTLTDVFNDRAVGAGIAAGFAMMEDDDA
jgi:hypothetical protein